MPDIRRQVQRPKGPPLHRLRICSGKARGWSGGAFGGASRMKASGRGTARGPRISRLKSPCYTSRRAMGVVAMRAPELLRNAVISVDATCAEPLALFFAIRIVGEQ
jgi:hypothetical protein